MTRSLVEADGTRQTYTYNQALGVGLSLIVGFLSSLLGIGGGIIHVPALAYLLHFPVHVATATSHFVLAVMALVGTLVHVATGAFAHGVRRTTALAIGVLIGAQLGARASNRIRGAWIMRGLAIALGFIGARVSLAGACPLSLSTTRYQTVFRPSPQKRTTESAAPTPTTRRRSTFRQSANQAAPINAHVFQSTSASRPKWYATRSSIPRKAARIPRTIT